MAKSSKEKMRDLRERRKLKGLKRLELYIDPDKEEAVRHYVKLIHTEPKHEDSIK